MLKQRTKAFQTLAGLFALFLIVLLAASWQSANVKLPDLPDVGAYMPAVAIACGTLLFSFTGFFITRAFVRRPEDDYVFNRAQRAVLAWAVVIGLGLFLYRPTPKGFDSFEWIWNDSTFATSPLIGEYIILSGFTTVGVLMFKKNKRVE